MAQNSTLTTEPSKMNTSVPTSDPSEVEMKETSEPEPSKMDSAPAENVTPDPSKTKTEPVVATKEELLEMYSQTFEENMATLISILNLEPTEKIQEEIMTLTILLGGTIALEILHNFVNHLKIDLPLVEVNCIKLIKYFQVKSMAPHLNSLTLKSSQSDRRLFSVLHSTLKTMKEFEVTKGQLKACKILEYLSLIMAQDILGGVLNLGDITSPEQREGRVRGVVVDVSILIKNYHLTYPKWSPKEEEVKSEKKFTKKKKDCALLDDLMLPAKRFYVEQLNMGESEVSGIFKNVIHFSDIHDFDLDFFSFFAIKLLYMGKYYHARQILNKIIDKMVTFNKSEPDNPTLLKLRHQMALVQKKLGKWSEGLCACREVYHIQQNPQDKLEVGRTLADFMGYIGDFEEALKFCDDLLASPLLEQVEDLNWRGNLKLKLMTTKAFILKDQGKFTDALKIFQQNLETLTAKFKNRKEHPQILNMKRHMATCLANQSEKRDEALKMMEQVCSCLKKILDEDHPLVLISMETMANILVKEKRQIEASDLFKKLEESYQNLTFLDPEHPRCLSVQEGQGSIMLQNEKYEQAEPIFRSISEIRLKNLDPTHPYTIHVRHILITVLCHLKKDGECLEIFQEISTAYTKKFGHENSDTLTTKKNLAKFLQFHLEKFDEAQEIFQEVYKIFCDKLGEDNLETLKSLSDLALLHNSKGDDAEALKLCDQLIDASVKNFGPEHDNTVSFIGVVSLIVYLKKDKELALKMYDDLSENIRKSLTLGQSELLTYLYNVGHKHYKNEKYGDAKSAFELLEQVCTRILGVEHQDCVHVKCTIASTLHHLGRYAEAVALYEDACDICRNQKGADVDPLPLCKTMESMSAMLSEQGKYTMAIRVIDEICQILENQSGNPEHSFILKVKNHKAIIMHQQDKKKESMELFEHVLEIRKRLFGEKHPDTLETEHNMSYCRAQEKMAKSRFFGGGMAANFFGSGGLFGKK